MDTSTRNKQRVSRSTGPSGQDNRCTNYIEGKLKEVGGKIQEAAGKVVGSEEQQAKGLANQVEGKVQKKVGDVKDAVETITRKP
eukprot:gene18328-21929_t